MKCKFNLCRQFLLESDTIFFAILKIILDFISIARFAKIKSVKALTHLKSILCPFTLRKVNILFKF